MQSRNRIFKVVVPLIFVTLIGVFVAFNSGWFSKVEETPKVLEKKEKVESTKTPLTPQKTDKPLTIEKETVEKPTKKLVTSPVESFGTDTTKPISREIIMSSSKSMTIMSVKLDTQVKIEPFKYKPRKKMMSSSKSMQVIDTKTKTKMPN